MYRTSPLAGLWTHQKGGTTNGRSKNLRTVVWHYNAIFKLGLTLQQRSDLTQYLLSL
jgi:hypothetical protein